MKKKKIKIETLTIGNEYAKIFELAIKNTEKTTYLKNDSIKVDIENGKILIEPTSALFLVQVGMEYQKLITNPLSDIKIV